MPTVLDLLGLRIPPVVEGRSLVPLARGQAFQRRTPVMASRFADPGARPDGPVRENRTDSFAFVEPKWKLIYRTKDVGLDRIELYDRVSDRKEQNNVAAANPREVDRIMAEVGQWMEAQKKIRAVLGRGAKSTLDAQTLEQLRSLGYLGGSRQ